MMRPAPHHAVLLLVTIFLFTCGCFTEPPVQQPAVSVSNIALADISLGAMTINTTVLISNPNPVGGHLDRIAFDVWYLDDNVPKYLGHGEQYNVDIRENGNTSIVIPVTIGNLQALYALGSLSEKGSIVIRVNGSAGIDVKVTSWEMPFDAERQFAAGDFEPYLSRPVIAPVNLTQGMKTAKDLYSQFTG
jgi:LEA14-like dessication related protein